MADKFMKSITFVEGGDAYYPLPKVTNADDGKILKVVNGKWRLDDLIPLPYLSFLGNEDFTLKTGNASKNWDGTLEYSTDGSTWSTWDGTEIASSGSKLYLRGTGNTKITGNSTNYRFVFTGTSALKIACKGNIENLLDYETVSAGGHSTMGNSCYRYMFYNCTSLTTAPELPATTLANSCYKYMFGGCASLTTAPALPATTLANGCYRDMFKGCTSLTTAPALPATTLAVECYGNMFRGCTALTTAPSVLPATTLVEGCYKYMFGGCTSLATAPSVLPATTLAARCYQFMFEFTAIDAIPRIMATTYATDSCKGMFDDIKTLNVYSASGTDHTYGWTAPSSASTYCSGMFGSDDGESEWAKLDGSNFPNSGTPTDGTTYYFKTVA